MWILQHKKNMFSDIVKTHIQSYHKNIPSTHLLYFLFKYPLKKDFDWLCSFPVWSKVYLMSPERWRLYTHCQQVFFFCESCDKSSSPGSQEYLHFYKVVGYQVNRCLPSMRYVFLGVIDPKPNLNCENESFLEKKLIFRVLLTKPISLLRIAWPMTKL